MSETERAEPLTFPLDEPPTRPNRLSSTGRVNATMMRATAALVDAEQQAYRALDSMIEVLRNISTVPPPDGPDDEGEL